MGAMHDSRIWTGLKHRVGVRRGLGTAGLAGSITFGDSRRRRESGRQRLGPARSIAGQLCQPCRSPDQVTARPATPTARPGRRQMAPGRLPRHGQQGLAAAPDPLRSAIPARALPPPAMTETAAVPGNARAAVPQPIAGQLAHQQDGGIPRTGALTGHPPDCERAGGPRPVCLPASRVTARTAGGRTGKARPAPPFTSSRNTPPARPIRGRP